MGLKSKKVDGLFSKYSSVLIICYYPSLSVLIGQIMTRLVECGGEGERYSEYDAIYLLGPPGFQVAVLD